jgi:hypothetical protein
MVSRTEARSDALARVKRLYDARMYLRERGALTTGNPMLDDPENWLRDRLRRGGRITYDREVEF